MEVADAVPEGGGEVQAETMSGNGHKTPSSQPPKNALNEATFPRNITFVAAAEPCSGGDGKDEEEEAKGAGDVPIEPLESKSKWAIKKKFHKMPVEFLHDDLTGGGGAGAGAGATAVGEFARETVHNIRRGEEEAAADGLRFGVISGADTIGVRGKGSDPCNNSDKTGSSGRNKSYSHSLGYYSPYGAGSVGALSSTVNAGYERRRRRRSRVTLGGQVGRLLVGVSERHIEGNEEGSGGPGELIRVVASGDNTRHGRSWKMDGGFETQTPSRLEIGS